MVEIISYEKFCQLFNQTEEDIENANLLIYIQDWIVSKIINENQNNTNIGLDELFLEFSKSNSKEYVDLLSKIINDTINASKHIIENMRTKIIRENLMTPVHKVREVDSYSLQWLSRQPGRSIKEKVGSKNSMMAVRRRMSLDTAENQLFLAFAKQMVFLLENKIDYFPEEHKNNLDLEFYNILSSIKYENEFNEISKWKNLPPNNTLLTNNYYKKIWKSWNDLKDLDDLINKYNKNIDICLTSIFKIELITSLKKHFKIPQLPFKIDYTTYCVEIICDDLIGIDNNDDIIQFKFNEKTISITYKNNKLHLIFNNNLLTIEYNNVNVIDKYCVKFSNIASLVDAIINLINAPSLNKSNVEIKLNDLIYKKVIFDLFSIYPQFIGDNTFNTSTKRLIQQEFIDESNYLISCENSDAIILNDNISTYSFLSAISNANEQQMKNMVLMLKNNLKTEEFCFLFPDIFGAFEIGFIKKNCRLAFKRVQAFPNSISSIFEFQETDKFTNYFNSEDFVIVLDLVDEKVTITLVQGVYDENRFNENNKYKGIIWERHPTHSIFDNSLIENINNTLQNLGLNKSQLLSSIFSINGLKSEKDKLLIINDDKTFINISDKFIDTLNNVKINIDQILDKFIKDSKYINDKSKVHIISLCDIFESKNELIYFDKEQLLKGFSKYEELRIETDLSLWKDNLPNLSIKQLYGTFDLINDTTVLPKFNTKQEIYIPNTFTLPKDKKEYKFKLIQSQMDNKRQYQAVIKHKNFPLKENIECKLIMTYSYGEEQPYELIFKPLNYKKAGFVEAKVNWELNEYKDLVYPTYPIKKSWSYMEHYPDRTNIRTQNILYWIVSSLKLIDKSFDINLADRDVILKDKLNAIRYIIDGKESIILLNSRDFQDESILNNSIDKISCDLYFDDKFNDARTFINLSEGFSATWRNVRDGYCAIKTIDVDCVPTKVYFFDNEFLLEEDFSTNVTNISFTIKKKKDGGRASNILSEKYFDMPIYRAKNIRKYNSISDDIINNRTLFALHTVFSENRSIYDKECPEYLRIAFENNSMKWLKVYNNKLSNEQKQKLFTMLCLISKDLGESFYDMIYNLLDKTDENRIQDSLGYALGDYTSEQQKLLFDKILEMSSSKIITLLSYAMWKNEEFIFNLPEDKIINLFDISIDILENYCNEKVFGRNDINNRKKRYLGIIIEFILGVFRLRKSCSKRLYDQLSLKNPKVQVLYNITENLIDSKIDIYSRLEFVIKKSNSLSKLEMCDLLFALLVYTTGELGDNDIIIDGITE